jgi:hypothetical protein
MGKGSIGGNPDRRKTKKRACFCLEDLLAIADGYFGFETNVFRCRIYGPTGV